MTEILIEYDALALSQQVLERQQQHAARVADYLTTHAGIGDATGVLLAAFDPLSRAAVGAAEVAASTVSRLEQAMVDAVGRTAADLAATDATVGEQFADLATRLGGGSVPGSAPDLGGPPLPPAAESAPEGHGSVDSYAWEKAQGTVDTLSGGAADAVSLIEGLSQWGATGPVREVVDASSFLVAPQVPENPVQDLRWSAGALLGGIDWVAEQFLGYSILDRCVYEPLAGDWEGLYRASEAWAHAGSATSAVARNHAGLVAASPRGWQGLSGNAFRVAMTGLAGAALGLGTAFETAAGMVKNISTACKLACAGIGAALRFIANKLLKMAAQAATPVIGWAVGAVTAYSDIDAIISKVRLVYTIIETVASAIQGFAEAKASIMDRLALIEDLAQGAATSVVTS
ncbi:hypothetical protein [Nocardioides ferulae]|uniref:hypothetical protein n=1 Tax=Nocardioides ferulae TaxID=2340821 RepID=UPI000EB111A1|nr:hypothetical protein [Nocardioides ferulae]